MSPRSSPIYREANFSAYINRASYQSGNYEVECDLVIYPNKQLHYDQLGTLKQYCSPLLISQKTSKPYIHVITDLGVTFPKRRPLKTKFSCTYSHHVAEDDRINMIRSEMFCALSKSGLQLYSTICTDVADRIVKCVELATHQSYYVN